MVGLNDVIKNEIIPLVVKASPVLASILGSPAAGVGIYLLNKVFNIPKSDFTTLSQALQSSDAVSKIKEIEFKYGEILAIINAYSADYLAEVDDKKNARHYGFQYKNFLTHLAYLVTFGFFVALFALFLPINISTEERNLLSMLVGMLASKWQTIIDFFFGSSRHNNGDFNFKGVTKNGSN